MPTSVLPLAECTADAADRIGGKALGLGALVRQGLPVPPGFAVTTDAYRACVNGASLGDQIVAALDGATTPAQLRDAGACARALFTDAMLSADIAAEIDAAYAALGADVPVAVRSSATAEDTADASFAGQQDTYLWIVGAQAVREHVVRCWASLFTAQAIGYRARFGVHPEDLAMGVVVQQMVPADVAGVMMTIDPVTGDPGTIFVSVAYGLGEGVVKGDVGSDSHWVDKATLAPKRAELGLKEQAHRFDPDAGAVVLTDVPQADRERPALSDADLRAVAEVGREVEAAFGSAQDLEWAMADGQLFLLQSRPETVFSQRGPTAPEPHNVLHHPTLDSATWSTTNLAESIPGVPTPLGWSIWYEAGELAVRRAFQTIGALSAHEATMPDRIEDSVIGVFYGHAAIRVDLLCQWVERVPGTDGEAMARDAFSAVPEGYVSRAQPRYYPRVLARSLVPFFVGPRLIVEDQRRVEGLYEQALAAIPEASEQACRRWLAVGAASWKESLYRQVLVTLGTIQPMMDRLISLADQAGVSGQELMAGYGGHEETQAVTDAWACSRGQLDVDAFTARHGFHGWRSGELSATVWREDNTPVHQLVDRYKSKDDDADPAQAEHARATRRAALEADFLAKLPRARRAPARIVLKLAARYVPLRGVGKVSFLRGVDIVRAAARRLGELLAADGRLDDPGDVFYLTFQELEVGLPDNARELIAARRADRARYEQLAVPQSFRGYPQTGLPPIDPDAELIEGTAAGPGIVEGLARVVVSPEHAPVEEGEILIAHDTDPSWASLMFLSAGLVADIGGIMSHTAVVARELSIPCVVNTKHASRSLQTGDRIRLDGTRGLVEILERKAE